MSGSEKKLSSLALDKLVHEKARLMTLTYLASSDSAEVSFTELRDALGLSAGNLSVQLKNLEDAGYISITKSFKDNKPNTAVSLSVSGHAALEAYLSEMEVILQTVRRQSK
ncbi:MAG TPA: transcriptional regulator [Spirochaetales bacterium]|nr:transcriptional regulator [Spirochaetales bacterium]